MPKLTPEASAQFAQEPNNIRTRPAVRLSHPITTPVPIPDVSLFTVPAPIAFSGAAAVTSRISQPVPPEQLSRPGEPQLLSSSKLDIVTDLRDKPGEFEGPSAILDEVQRTIIDCIRRNITFPYLVQLQEALSRRGYRNGKGEEIALNTLHMLLKRHGLYLKKATRDVLGNDYTAYLVSNLTPKYRHEILAEFPQLTERVNTMITQRGVNFNQEFDDEQVDRLDRRNLGFPPPPRRKDLGNAPDPTLAVGFTQVRGASARRYTGNDLGSSGFTVEGPDMSLYERKSR